MPGIYGLGSSSPDADLASIAASIGERLTRDSLCVDEQFGCDNRVAIGRVYFSWQSKPAEARSVGRRSLTAMVDGEIYDYEEQRRALESQNVHFVGDSVGELFSLGYQQAGHAFFRHLHGKFAAVIWDESARSLTLVSDRYGMKPLYYAHSPGRFSFASKLHALLADRRVGRRPDLTALAQFFAFGQLLGQDTLLKGARLLPPASTVTYELDRDRIDIQRYWQLEPSTETRGTSETLERIDSAFVRAIERSTNGAEGLGLSLSGGMDARTILAVAARPDRRLKTVTMGMSGSIDHRSSQILARIAGCDHHSVFLGTTFLANYESHLRQMVRLTDGQYLCQCIVMPTLPVYRELGIRVLLRGHAGELMHMRKAYSFSVDPSTLTIRSESQLLDWLWNHLTSYLLNGTNGELFAPALRSEMQALALESLRACWSETAKTTPPSHQIWQLFLNQRLRRETALSMVEFDSVVETRLPYMDNELIDELFAAPPELKLDDRIQSFILRRHRPEFLKVVNVNTGAAVTAGPWRRKFGKLKIRMLSKLGIRGFQPYERLGLWLRRELRPLVMRLLLDDRLLSRGLFDAESVRRIVNGHLNGARNHTFLILALMVFETAQREFVDGDAAGSVAAEVIGAGAA